jgi:hypothetical protein
VRAALVLGQRGKYAARVRKCEGMAYAAPGGTAGGINEGSVIREAEARAQRDQPVVGFFKTLDDAEIRQECRLALIGAEPKNPY